MKNVVNFGLRITVKYAESNFLVSAGEVFSNKVNNFLID